MKLKCTFDALFGWIPHWFISKLGFSTQNILFTFFIFCSLEMAETLGLYMLHGSFWCQNVPYPTMRQKQYIKFDLSLKVPHLFALGHKCEPLTWIKTIWNVCIVATPSIPDTGRTVCAGIIWNYRELNKMTVIYMIICPVWKSFPLGMEISQNRV